MANIYKTVFCKQIHQIEAIKNGGMSHGIHNSKSINSEFTENQFNLKTSSIIKVPSIKSIS